MTTRTTIIDVDLNGKPLQVISVFEGFPEPTYYEVIVDGVVKHPDCSVEDALRALGHYINGLSFQLLKISEDRATIAHRS